MGEIEFIGALIKYGLGALILVFTVAKPIYKSVVQKAEMKDQLESLNRTFGEIKDNLKRVITDNEKEHEKLWNEVKEHDNKLTDHEYRLKNLEEK